MGLEYRQAQIPTFSYLHGAPGAAEVEQEET